MTAPARFTTWCGSSAPAPLYLGADHEPATQCEVLDWIAKRLGLPAPPRRDAHTETSGKRCRNARLVSSGFRFLHPSYREGYDAIIE